jgi:hypothetical protein
MRLVVMGGAPVGIETVILTLAGGLPKVLTLSLGRLILSF